MNTLPIQRVTSTCTRPCSTPPVIVPTPGTVLSSEAMPLAAAGAATFAPATDNKLLAQLADQPADRVQVDLLPIDAGQLQAPCAT